MQISSHINHTNRRKIKHTEVEIELIDQDEKPPAFNATFNLNLEKLPPAANLFVEAYHRNTSQRFDFGTAGAPLPPEDTTLTDIDLSGPTLFRVKIVDNSEKIGRLVASAERLTPKDDDAEEQRASLMIFKSVPEMGNLTWKISFNEAHKPVLCINNRIPEAKHQLMNNPVFQSLVLPAAFREVLLYILWNGEEEPEEGTWHSQWIDFANRLGQEECPITEKDPDLLMGWVDDVVRAFSESHHFCDHLVKRMEDNRYA
jgi:hypothetical protein